MLALIPMDSPRETVVLAVAQAIFVLACFQLRLYLDKELMHPHQGLFRFPRLLLVSSSLSCGKLSTCCLVFLVELGLPIVQDVADRLHAGRGDRCRDVRSRTTCRCTRSQNRATR